MVGGICHVLKYHLLALVGLQLAKQSATINWMVRRSWRGDGRHLPITNAVQHLNEKGRRVLRCCRVLSEGCAIDSLHHLCAKTCLSRARTPATSGAVHTHHNKDGFLHREFTSQVYNQTAYRCNTQTQRKRGKEITVKWACIFHNRQ